MTNLQKLQEIARATPTTWTSSQTYEEWAEVFNPRLIEKLLAAYSAACEMREIVCPYTELGDYIPEVGAFDKAREALDAEMGAM